MDSESRFKKFEMLLKQKRLSSEIPQPPWHRRFEKCGVTSELCRVEGNKKYKNGEFESAISFYNGSLRYAPPGSKEIPLAYGNRSAVYFEMGKYALAIENIKLSRENGYPAEKMTQLNDRFGKCGELMAAFGPAKNFEVDSLLKLSYPPNKKIPFIVDCLELRKNEKYGRYVVTTKELKTGDVIAIENPAFSWLNDSQLDLVCLFCTKKNSGSLIPCFCCTSVMYCSEECQKKAALVHRDALYRVDCSTTAKSLKMQLDAFRVAGGVNELLELLKGNESKTIFDFDFSDPNDPSYEKSMLIALNGLYKNVQSYEYNDILLERLLNFPPNNEKKRTAEERKELSQFIKNQFYLRAANFLCHHCSHHGIFLFQSLLNHSCLPNIVNFKFDEKCVSIVARPIKAGEQIFVNYGAVGYGHTKRERQLILQKHPFKCDCDSCVHDYPIPFPCKDRSFVHPPRFVVYKPAEAIKLFKKNCKYIDKNAWKMPCFEVATLIGHNRLLVECIAGNTLGLSI